MVAAEAVAVWSARLSLLSPVRAHRIACLLLPDFPIAVERVEQPDLVGRPVIVVAESASRKTVLAASAEARAAGVRVGLPVTAALARCPEAALRVARPTRYAEVDAALRQAVTPFSPVIEPAAPGELYLGLDGLTSLFGDEAALARALLAAGRAPLVGAQRVGPLPVQLGIARGKFPARVAALTAYPGRARQIPDSQTAAFLARQPVTTLPFGPSLVAKLEQLGLRRLADLAALPLAALHAQFGPLGRHLWALAQGRDDSPLSPSLEAEALVEGLAFDPPHASLDSLEWALRHLLDRLVRRLQFRAARRAQVQLGQLDGQVWTRLVTFRDALSDPRRIGLALRSKLASIQPSAPFTEMTVALLDLCPESGQQAVLPLGARPRHEAALQAAIAQLKARYGVSPVTRIIEVEPWSRLPERRYALIEYDLSPRRSA